MIYLERPTKRPLKCGLSTPVVFDDRFNYIRIENLLPGIGSLLRLIFLTTGFTVSGWPVERYCRWLSHYSVKRNKSKEREN